MTQEDKELIQGFLINKLFIKKELGIKHIADKINVENVILYHKLADIFEISVLSQTTLRYIERCFTMVAETQNFLECNVVLVKRILYSSNLHITSELEVYDAVNNWISHNTAERNKFAKDLLLSVRLPLLSDHALNHLLCSKTSSICKVDECKSIIQSVLLKNEKVFIKESSDSFTSRYCDQSLFNFLGCKRSEDKECSTEIKQISCYDFKNTETLDSITQSLYEALCLKGDIYVIDKLAILKI